MILVSFDFRDEIEPTLIPFIKKHNIQADVVVLHDPDANKWISKVDKGWSGSLPATLIYKGDSRQFYDYAINFDFLNRMVESCLKIE